MFINSNYFISIIIIYIIIILIFFKYLFKISAIQNNINILIEQNKNICKFFNNHKQKIIAISYANKYFQKQLEINKKSALKIGKVDEYYSYGPEDIDSNFKLKNKEVLSRKRGGGYWLWKPYFILKTLKEKLNEGDYLIYTDAGILYMESVDKIINFLKENHLEMWYKMTSALEKEYSKRDAFILIGVDMPFYYNSFHYGAGIQIYRKSLYTEKFLEELLYYSQDKRIITDDPNTQGQKNYEGFRENRHDETVLSLLTKKYGLFNLGKSNSNINYFNKTKRIKYPNIFCVYRRKFFINYNDIIRKCANYKIRDFI